LKQRIITGVIAGAAFVSMLALGGYWFLGLVVLLAIVGFDEYMKMNGLKEMTWTRYTGLFALLVLTVPWNTDCIGGHISVEAVVWLLLLVLFTITVLSKNKVTIDHAALIFIGIVYLGFGFHYMVITRWLEPHGLYWSLLVFFCTWASDSGAYFTGRAIGKHPLWPAISPNKTVEGALGGVVLSTVVAVAFSLVNPDILEISRAVLIGISAAVVGQMGDLIQSAYKRVKGIKDTGTFLPGHGGILDRVDSWLIVFPFLQLVSLIPH
jgi:phosphatidate cytidylyltransferase